MTYYLANIKGNVRFPYVIYDSAEHYSTDVFNLDCVYKSQCIVSGLFSALNDDGTLRYLRWNRYSSVCQFMKYNEFEDKTDILEFKTLKKLREHLDGLRMMWELKK